jgi:uncharacterized protein YqjF (DUF2071 family)
MHQRWHDLLFAHWPVPAELLRPHVPGGLSVDTFDGHAWLGVVPFRMSGIRPRSLPAVPWLSAFPELNVRTYVTDGQRPGVWFYSLDAGNPLAVTLARAVFHLPYYHAAMSVKDDGDCVQYVSRRTHRGAPAAEFIADYKPVGDPYRSTPGSLEHWLTERYCLYAADGVGQLYRGEIHHEPWPLQPADAEFRVNTMVASHGIELPSVHPLLHFARRLDVIIWTLEQMRQDVRLVQQV